MYGSPGKEEDDADHHQDQVGSSSPSQFPLLSLAPNDIARHQHCWLRCDGAGNSALRYIKGAVQNRKL